ncbi:MAG: WD40/YVTN/BNR-like repeat-containing protein [Gemmatimonas sp.]
MDDEALEMLNDATLTRRGFLLRSGQLGWMFSVLGSPFGGLAVPARRQFAEMVSGAQRRAAALPLNLLSGFQWRTLGPFRGGRVAAATGVPGRPNEFYFGAVNGGVWKSIDAGRVWQPVFDSQPVASIGAIAVAPSAPDVVYVGSGESTLRDSAGFGNGVYKSADAGRSWTHLGLDGTQHIGKIAIDPRNPDVVFVAAIGHLYASNAERGVFRSRDGGKNWEKVLFKGPDVGAVEVVIDPTNSQVVYAGLWNTRRPPWFTYSPTNGPGGGIYKSTDGGSTWTQLTAGLPKEGIGRTGIAIAASNPRRMYAVVDCLLDEKAPAGAHNAPTAGTSIDKSVPRQGGFFRSDDAGATWTRLSSDESLWGRGWYFCKLAVDPKNPDLVYVSNVAVSRSMDGGRHWVTLRGSPGGDDYHQLWISPDETNTMIVASDQGAIITRNAKSVDAKAVTWSSWLNQPTAQMYHISVDYRTPYWVTGAQQDSGAVAVRSRGKFAEISTRDWEPIGPGGESGYTAGDPLHPGIVFGGTGERWNLETNRQLRGTTAPKASGKETDRADWTQPLVFSKADPRALYYASQFLYKTTDGAKSWKRISGDLTRADPGVPPNLDAEAAAHVDRNGKRGVIYTIAPSPLMVPLVWVGTDDGSISRTPDDGRTWIDVTPAALTAWSRVTTVEASHIDVNVAYASVDRHQLQDFDPYIYRTRDAGKTWQPITNGLPRGAYVHVIKEDPQKPGTLFAGTERGAYVSVNDGDDWQPLQLNLPVTSVRDFEVHENDLIVGTHGRGIWVIDDISPLRQRDDVQADADVHLFKPLTVIATAQEDDNGTPLQKDEPYADNPVEGAVIYYWLKSPAAGAVMLEILDAHGTVVATIPAKPKAGAEPGAKSEAIKRISPAWEVPPPGPLPTSAGMHRVVWPTIEPGSTEDSATPEERQPRVHTGMFTARLSIGAKRWTQEFEVLPENVGT